MPRDTTTGRVLELTVLPALHAGGYSYALGVHIGTRLGCGRHVIDAIVEKDSRRILLSLKWQQVSGTAEQKVPFEVICLADALTIGSFDRAYLVLGGEGWTLRDFYSSGGLNRYLRSISSVQILTLEAFIATANRGGL